MASRLLILTWAPNQESGIRIGFVVSKRVARHAVDRNYLKRLLSEAMRPLLHNLAGGWDIVLNARQQALGIDLPALKQDVTQLLRRAQLLASSPSSGSQAVEYTQRLL